MLKVTRGKLTFIVPDYWINGGGFLKPKAVCALRVFFRTKTNEEADTEQEKREVATRKGGWYKYSIPKGGDMGEI